MIDEHWAEIVDSVPDIEELAEEGPAELRHVAAAVASKCYYHLEDYNQAVVLALGAGEHFDVESHSEYVDTIVSKCIDTYAEQRVQAATTSKEVHIDARLGDVVNRMFERCFRDHELTQAIGIALETRRIDMLRRAITVDPSQTAAMLQHCVQLAHTVVKRKEFREQVLEALVEVRSDLVRLPPGGPCAAKHAHLHALLHTATALYMRVLEILVKPYCMGYLTLQSCSCVAVRSTSSRAPPRTWDWPDAWNSSTNHAK